MSTKVVSSLVVSNGLVQSGTSIDSSAAGQVLIRDGGALLFRALTTADVPGSGGGGGSGTVTSFSAGDCPPLFTTTEATVTSTPALSFVLTNQSANTIFAGPVSGGAAAPTFRNIAPADMGNQAASNVLAGPVSGGAAPPTFRKLTADDMNNQAAHAVLVGPASGGATAPTFRALVALDLGTGTADATTFLRGDLTWAVPASGYTDEAAQDAAAAMIAAGTHTGITFSYNDAANSLSATVTASGGTTILDGAGPPTNATGSVGNYYEDTTNGALYGPKTASGYGADQRVTVAGTPSATTTGELAVRVQFARAGRITRVRYYRTTGSTLTLNVRVWSDSTTAKITEVADTQAAVAGYFTVTLPVPVYVAAGDSYTFSIGAAAASPRNTGMQTVGNTTDCTFVGFCRNGTVNSYPTPENVQAYYVEPIFEADQGWSLCVRSPAFAATTAGLAPASGGGAANFLRADGTWNAPIANLSTGTGTVPIAGLPALNGFTDADWAPDDRLPFYDTSAAANRDGQAAYLLGLARVAPGGRLTIGSGAPVNDGSAAPTLYYTPYLYDLIHLFDGTRWVAVQFAEASIGTAGLAANTNYDVYGFLSGTALALELLAWSNSGAGTSARATAVTIQDGRYCKSAVKTRLYLGTVRTTAATQFEDSTARRFVWNHYNRVRRKLYRRETAVSWSGVAAAFRQANGNAANQVEVVIGLSEDPVWLFAALGSTCASVVTRYTGCGIDSTTANTYDVTESGSVANAEVVNSHTLVQVGAGYHYFAYLEYGPSSVTFFGSEFGMYGWLFA